jgi:hypothetical protein
MQKVATAGTVNEGLIWQVTRRLRRTVPTGLPGADAVGSPGR